MVERGLQKSLPCRSVAIEDRHAGLANAFSNRIEGRVVERFFALEVVVKKSFIDTCSFGDLLGARSGEGGSTELANSSFPGCGRAVDRRAQFWVRVGTVAVI